MHELTDEDIDRLRRSFDLIWPVATRVTTGFYDRLFAAAPESRALFHGDMDEQKRKFISTLAAIVGSIDSAMVYSSIETLARHHRDYGVQPELYRVAGEALLASLEQGLGADWTPDTAAAWAKAYAFLADRMTPPA